MTISAIGSALLGLISLFAGRQLYWVFVGAAGFLLAFNLAQRFFGVESEVLLLILGLVAGVAGALLAVLVQRFAVALAGFIAGGFLLFYGAQLLGLESDVLTTILFIAGGILGAILTSILFDPALIILSSLLGASLLAQTAQRSLDLTQTLTIIILLVLVIVGLAVQFSAWQPRARRGEDSDRAT